MSVGFSLGIPRGLRLLTADVPLLLTADIRLNAPFRWLLTMALVVLLLVVGWLRVCNTTDGMYHHRWYVPLPRPATRSFDSRDNAN